MSVNNYASHEKVAQQFGVHRSRVQAWVKSGAPLTDEKYLAQWLLTREGLKESVRREAERITGRKTQVRPVSAIPVQSEEQEAAESISAAFNKGAAPTDLASSNAKLAAFRDHCAGRLQEATNADDRPEIDYWGKQYRAYEEVLQKGQLLAKKLGIDNGELMKKEDAERFLRAVAYWLMRCVDASLHELCPQLAGKDDPRDIHAALEPYLLEHRFLIPLMRAAHVDGPTALPAWGVAALTDAVDDYVENGAEEAKNVTP